jgi:hypothetical protein
VNPGFDPKNVMTMEIQLPEGGKYLERVPGGDMEKTLPSVTAFYEQLLEKIKGIPGLVSWIDEFTPAAWGGKVYVFDSGTSCPAARQPAPGWFR